MEIDLDIQRAKDFAHRSHDSAGQTRKYSGDPYWVHTDEVAEFVRLFGGDKNQIITGHLHDTVEDVKTVSLDIIRTEFGADVADLVSDLSGVTSLADGNRAIRKQIEKEHTAQASPRAKTVKLADILSNFASFSLMLENDRKFAIKYLKEKLSLLEVLKEGDKSLYIRVQETLNQAQFLVNDTCGNEDF